MSSNILLAAFYNEQIRFPGLTRPGKNGTLGQSFRGVGETVLRITPAAQEKRCPRPVQLGENCTIGPAGNGSVLRHPPHTGKNGALSQPPPGRKGSTQS